MLRTARLKFWDTRGYGFVTCEDGDAFCHVSTVKAVGLAELPEDEEITYETELGPKGEHVVRIIAPNKGGFYLFEA